MFIEINQINCKPVNSNELLLISQSTIKKNLIVYIFYVKLFIMKRREINGYSS